MGLNGIKTRKRGLESSRSSKLPPILGDSPCPPKNLRDFVLTLPERGLGPIKFQKPDLSTGVGL